MAAVDFQKSFTSIKEPSGKQTSATSQIPNPRNGFHFGTAEASSQVHVHPLSAGNLGFDNGSGDCFAPGLSSAAAHRINPKKHGISAASNRSRLRLFKSSRGLGFHLPKSDASNDNSSSTNDAKFTKVTHVDSVFGASKENWSSNLNPNGNECSGNARKPTQVKGKSLSDLDFKNQGDGSVRERVMKGQLDFRNVGFVFGANKCSESRILNTEHSKSVGGQLKLNEKDSFLESESIFGTGRGNLGEKVYRNLSSLGVKSKNNNSSLGSEFWKRPQSDEIKGDAGEISERTSYANEKMLHEQKVNTSENWGFVFGDSKSSKPQVPKHSQCSESELKSKSCDLDAGPNLPLHQRGFDVSNKSGTGGSNFGSVFTDESSNSMPKSALGHNRSINNINQPNHTSGNCTWYAQSYSGNLDPHIGNGHGFVFGSSSLHELSHDMKKLSVDDVEKKAGFPGIPLPSGFPSSSSSSEPHFSVSTKPFIFQASYSKGSDGSKNQLQDDLKFKKTTMSSMSKDGHNPGSPCSRGVENNHQSNFSSLLFGLTSSFDFGPNPNGSSPFNLNYCLGLDKTRGSAKFRLDKGQRFKKNRRGFMPTDPVHLQSTQNDVSRQQDSQSPNSHPCGSPMDYSPYDPENCAPFSENTMNHMHTKSEEQVVKDNITPDDSKANTKESEYQKQFFFGGKSFTFSSSCTAGPARKIHTRRKNGLRSYNGKQNSTQIHTINMNSSSVQFPPSTFMSTVSKHSESADLGNTVDVNNKKTEKECQKSYEEVLGHHSSIFSANTSVQNPFSGFQTECTNSNCVPVSIKSNEYITKTDVNPDITNEKDKHIHQHCFTSCMQDFEKQKDISSVFTPHVNSGSQNSRTLKKYKAKVGNSEKYTSRNSLKKVIGQPSAVAQDIPASVKPQPQKNYEVNDSCAGSITSIEESMHVRKGPDAEIQAACEKWRIRGNQAYEAGHLSRAEEFYTNGINSVPPSKARGYCCQVLVLCYSNRAASRMSLNRLREALEDCKVATELDPYFLKAQIRAANCHLALGEVKDAMKLYKSCLESIKNVCLDRRLAIDAANGLQKAQKVLEWTDSSAELLQHKNPNSAVSASEIVSLALSVSSHSEKLLKMKGEALFMLRSYEEVIQLCESTIDFAGKNFTAMHSKNDENMDDVIIWRWILISKCHFHMGKLELALDVLEQHDLLRCSKDSRMSESVKSLAATLHELIHHKNAGNGAFQSGRLGEAVELYSAAISSSMESRPFAAICFCNRAAAYQALNQIIDAISDCSLAMALDGNYLKAVSRRVTLHEMIRDYEQATSDLRKLISLLELQLKDKTNQSSASDNTINLYRKELRQERRRLDLLEGKAKKGIPLDHYLILGVKASDTTSEIKKAYHKAALKHHPDKAGQFLARTERGDDVKLWKDIIIEVHNDADRLFKVVGEAYAVLSDSHKRAEYDHKEHLRKSQQESNGFGRQCSSPQYSRSSERQKWFSRKAM